MQDAAQCQPAVQLPTALERHWQALRRLQARIEDAAERALQARHQISLSEYLALAALAYSDDNGHLRQQVLAEAIPLNHSSVSRLVGRLERAGLSERYLCESDRRGVYTQLTTSGRRLVEAARETHLEALRTVLRDTRPDSELGPHAGYLLQSTAVSG